MPRTYRPENTGADFGEDLEDIGGVYDGHLYDPDLYAKNKYEKGGYSGTHIFLAVSTLICAIITFAHRSVHLHDFLDKGTPCGGTDVEYYLGYYQNEGEQFFVVLAIVFAAVLMVELLVRVAHVYPYETVSPITHKYMFTWYRVYRIIEAVLEMTLVAFSVLSLYAEMRHDSDSKTGAGRLWKEAGCDASEGMSLSEAISPASIDQHASTIGAILVGVYLLVVRVIGIEERHCDGLFNLDDLPGMDVVFRFVNRGRSRKEMAQQKGKILGGAAAAAGRAMREAHSDRRGREGAAFRTFSGSRGSLVQSEE